MNNVDTIDPSISNIEQKWKLLVEKAESSFGGETLVTMDGAKSTQEKAVGRAIFRGGARSESGGYIDFSVEGKDLLIEDMLTMAPPRTDGKLGSGGIGKALIAKILLKFPGTLRIAGELRTDNLSVYRRALAESEGSSHALDKTPGMIMRRALGFPKTVQFEEHYREVRGQRLLDHLFLCTERESEST